jgi:hypothetical protein
MARVVDGRHARGLIDASGWLSAAGRKTKEQIESFTDDRAGVFARLMLKREVPEVRG